MQGEFTIHSIGIGQTGGSVVRIILPSHSIVEVATNAVGFARLAAAGVRVDNDPTGLRKGDK